MPDDQRVPESIAPSHEPPMPEAGQSETGPMGTWERIGFWSKTAIAIFAGVPSAVIAIWVLVSLVVLTFHRHSIDLDEIGVPETLNKAGFTSNVATQHLRDAIYAVQELSGTTMKKTGIDTDQDLSGITIPKTGLSLQGVAAAVRSLVPGWRQEVSGEFVQWGDGILLRLRLNGKVIFSRAGKGGDPSTADTLLGKDVEGGGFRVVEETEPYIAASALFGGGKGDLAPAKKEADHIIALSGVFDEDPTPAANLQAMIKRVPDDDAQAEAVSASSLYIRGLNGILTPADEGADRPIILLTADENVLRAINLKGLIAEAQGNDTQAEKFFKMMPRFPLARVNLGDLYYHQEKLDLAVEEYRAAIWLDPVNAVPHAGLGVVYMTQGKPEMAIAEYDQAIHLDLKDAAPRAGLGFVYGGQGKWQAAIAEFDEAIQLDPKLAASHYGLGLVYSSQGKPEKAITEYQAAIQLDPTLALAHYLLGNMYYGQHKLEIAIGEFESAIHIEPTNELYYDNLGRSLRDAAASLSKDDQKAKWLQDACRVFAEGSKLAADDRNYPSVCKMPAPG